MGAGNESEIPARPCLFRRSHWSLARWESLVSGWGLVAEGRFFAGGWVSSTPYAGAGPIVGAAGSAFLLIGLDLPAGGWAWVEVLELGPLAHA